MEDRRMNGSTWFGRWLGYSDVSQIESWRPSFGAGWAHAAPASVVIGILVALALAAWFYGRLQTTKSSAVRWTLAALRGLVLAALLLVLADPNLEVTLVRFPEPVLWVGLDASDSMGIADELPAEQREPLDRASGLTASGSSVSMVPSRADYVRAFLASQDGVTTLTVQDEGDLPHDDLNHWSPSGTVTALGDSLEELSRRQLGSSLAGLVLFSDFDQNSGISPQDVVGQLGAPVFTVGVGPESAVDIGVDLLVPPTMKQAETSTLSVTVRQRELERTPVTVRVWAASLGSPEAVRIPVGEKTLTLDGSTTTTDLSFTPSSTGRFVFVAEVDSLPGETVTQNNQSRRDVRIIDDFLRLRYIESETTWEWRFVKEVFHRDKLVGMRGFRTFLRSADPIVRETNELFVSNLTLPRHEFFEADVIFLGDLPASALSTRFGEMTREFVDQFGGGLVVLGGPRFGPGQLAESPLADMLPVVVDPAGRRRDDKTFALQLTPLAAQFDFMQLGSPETGGLQPWSNLGKLPWYQPVLRVDPRATVLAEHPTDVCSDGTAKQPLIAIRPYGRGEVVYLGFNELWRLRRLHGEEYYRQFWGQLIHRLGLSHALGDQKRFVVRTDRRQYRSGDQVVITVEAYDEDFQPLSDDKLQDHQLRGEWVRPVPNDQGDRSDPLTITQLRPGVYETRVSVSDDGEHRLRVNDPITQSPVEIAVNVADLSIERRNPVRNVSLQEALASETGGRSYDLTNVQNFLKDFNPPRPRETTVEVIPLWNTWLTFCIVVGMMIAEWALRKVVNLP
ncbi:MAG: hypothetical protein B7Z55_08190 [Planctomycetales bacterium 12-60-4]|nr:MAG: hypothetical protein B7Z55_08190 [Planctomycetales bacterium 12-60-4]